MKINFFEFVALMASLSAMGALGIDTMLPALPAIGEALNVASENTRQLVISSYLFGFGLTQVVYGPLADRYGRKPIVLLCLTLFCITSLIASFATTFPLLIAARILQGMAAAAGRVLMVSIIRDRYEGRQMARVMSLTFIIFLAVPILAPAIGQFITLFAPWRAIFYVFAALGATLAIWTSLRLPETLHPDYRQKIEIKAIALAAREVIYDRFSIGYTLAGMMLMGTTLGYVNCSEQIYEDALGAHGRFPALFAITAFSMGISALGNSGLVERFGSRLLSHSAMIGFTLTATLHALWSITMGDTLISFTSFQFVTMFFLGFTGSNFSSMAMDPMARIAGTASSIQGMIATLGAAFIGMEIGQSYNGSPLPLVIGTALFGALTILTVLWTEGWQLFHARNTAVQ